MKIKTIIFDNHGVLTTGDDEEGYNEIANYLGVTLSEVESIWQGALSAQYDEGSITTEKFLQRIINGVGSKKSVKGLLEIYKRRYSPKKEVREFAKKLKKDFEIVLLTNAGDFFDEYNKRWNMEEIFDKNKIFVSAKLKMRKPHKDIYLYVLNKLDLKPEETVFIDDSEEFIETAKKLGMHIILFKSLEQVEKDLESILQHQTSLSSRE